MLFLFEFITLQTQSQEFHLCTFFILKMQFSLYITVYIISTIFKCLNVYVISNAK